MPFVKEPGNKAEEPALHHPEFPERGVERQPQQEKTPSAHDKDESTTSINLSKGETKKEDNTSLSSVQKFSSALQYSKHDSSKEDDSTIIGNGPANQSDETHHEETITPTPLLSLDRNMQYSTPGAFRIPGIRSRHASNNDENEDDSLHADASTLDENNDNVITAEISTIDCSAQNRRQESQESLESGVQIEKSLKRKKQDFWMRLGIGSMIIALAIVATVIALEFSNQNNKNPANESAKANQSDQESSPDDKSATEFPSSTPSLRPSMVPSSRPTTSLAPSQSPTTLDILAIDNLDRENFREWKVFSLQWGYYFGACEQQSPPQFSVECLDPDDVIFVLGQHYNETSTTCHRPPGEYQAQETVVSYNAIWMFACASRATSPPAMMVSDVVRASWTGMEGNECGLKSDYDLGPQNHAGTHVAMEPVISTSLRMGVVCFENPPDSQNDAPPQTFQVHSVINGCLAGKTAENDLVFASCGNRLYLGIRGWLTYSVRFVFLFLSLSGWSLNEDLDSPSSHFDQSICVGHAACKDPLVERNETCRSLYGSSSIFELRPPSVNTSCFWQREDHQDVSLLWDVSKLNQDLLASGYEMSNYFQRVHETIQISRTLWNGLPLN